MSALPEAGVLKALLKIHIKTMILKQSVSPFTFIIHDYTDYSFKGTLRDLSVI